MPLVNIHVGVTFQIGAVGSNQYGKLDIEFKDLDPLLPLEEQLAAGKEVASKAFEVVVAELNKQLEVVFNLGKITQSKSHS